MQKTPFHSYKIGRLAEGCRLCVQGKKLVLFSTGICNRRCFYCPLSEQKKNKDIFFANEWDTGFKGGKVRKKHLDILFKEAELTGARGAGITGGDPLLVCERTAMLIRKLKSRYGKKFHIHLYTSLRNVTKPRLKLLHAAGLDEIRFHPVLWGDPNLERVHLAREFPWDVGVEIPVIPGYDKETERLTDWLDGKIDFLNLNELEISDTNHSSLVKLGYKTKNSLSYGVEGSEDMAKRLMRRIEKKGYRYNVHYCTGKLKDSVQMAQRLKRRAKNAALPFDEVTSEGMLIRGVIYPNGLEPGVGYRRKLNLLTTVKKKTALTNLSRIRTLFSDSFLDDVKPRLIVPLKEISAQSRNLKSQNYIPARVEEYPTHDGMEVEIEFL